MPIYEFYCESCNTLFNFLSKTVDTITRPPCPKCEEATLSRRLSSFAIPFKSITSGQSESDEVDEAKIEAAFINMMKASVSISEPEPKQVVGLMRDFAETTGVSLGSSMREAISRIEKGEDPEQVEREMGDLFDERSEFVSKASGQQSLNTEPAVDDTLYDLQ